MISMILASTNTGGIGNRGTLPWPKHQQDLNWFKQHTQGHVVIMGRKTWDDPLMPKPLPNRISYVVTSSTLGPQYTGRVNRILADPLESLEQIKTSFPSRDIFVIGGQRLYETFAPVAERIYLTRMKGNYWCDTRINLERMLACFQIKSVTPGENCTYEVWDRILYI